MPGKFLLDTSSVIPLLRDADAFAHVSGDAEVYISVVTLGELYFGAPGPDKPEQNRAKVNQLTAGLPVLNCDGATAEADSVLKDRIRRKGKPIPDHDLWIAATAVQRGLTLVTRDQHFEHIDGLDRESW